MKKITLIFLVSLFSAKLFSQAINNSQDSIASAYEILQKDSIGKKFIIVEKESEFKGGSAGWIKYLQRSMNSSLVAKYVKIPKGEKTGQAQVIVSFIIDAEGNPGNIETTSDKEVHPKLVKEAIRIIQESPKWIPAEQEIFVDQDINVVEQTVKEKEAKRASFRKVKSYKKQPITFVAERE